MPIQIGQVIINRYRILNEGWQGGMAIVYKAVDTRLDRLVAIKVIQTTQESAGKLLERFKREAKISAQLSHPHIVKVIDYGEYEGQPFFVMEFITGGSLKDRLEKFGPMSWQEAARLLIPIAQALDYSHHRNIIHRDVKPGNILLTDTGAPMLSDFGIVKFLSGDETLIAGQHSLTTTGMGIGTPAYMAPEQARGLEIDGRADVYALGVVFYELVTGRTPYEGPTPLEVLLRKTTQPLPDPRKFRPDLPESVCLVLKKALAVDPGNRYGSMQLFTTALETVASERRGSVRAIPKYLIVPAGILAALVIIYLGFRVVFNGIATSPAVVIPASDITQTPGVTLIPPVKITRTKTFTPVFIPSYTLTPVINPSKLITDTRVPVETNDLAFISDRSGQFALYIGDTQFSGDPSNVSFGGNVYYPSFCGNKIAYEGHSSNGQWIYLYDMQTSQAERLNVNGSPANLGVPSCSHGGRYLAYTEIGARPWGLVVVDLTNREEVFRFSDTPVNGNASWSMDNGTLVFMANNDLKNMYYTIKLTRNFGHTSTLSYSSDKGDIVSETYPAISPDGSQVAFVCKIGDNRYICEAPVSGSKANVLTLLGDPAKQGSVYLPAGTPNWDATGEWIYFYNRSAGANNTDLFRMHADGSGLQDLTSNWNSNELMPVLHY